MNNWIESDIRIQLQFFTSLFKLYMTTLVITLNVKILKNVLKRIVLWKEIFLHCLRQYELSPCTKNHISNHKPYFKLQYSSPRPISKVSLIKIYYLQPYWSKSWTVFHKSQRPVTTYICSNLFSNPPKSKKYCYVLKLQYRPFLKLQNLADLPKKIRVLRTVFVTFGGIRK